MAKELPYFKFEPSEWLEGEIQILSDIAIVCFINICSGYWLKLGCISYAFALHKYCRKDASIMQELINAKIISVDNENIVIKFLDAQLKEFNSLSEKRKEAAEKRWSNANAFKKESKSNAIREEKRKEEKMKEDKKRLNKFNPPTLSEVENYFFENGYKKESGTKAFKYYETGNWKDSAGKQVKNWKQKMQAVWFKDENKIINQQTNPIETQFANRKRLA